MPALLPDEGRQRDTRIHQDSPLENNANRQGLLQDPSFMVNRQKISLPEDKAKAKSNGIGTLQETSLHASLKEWYRQPGDSLEVLVDGFVIDIVRGETLIEIQTRNFSAIKRKLQCLLEKHPLRLVYPISREKWIISQSIDGNENLQRRKSPRRAEMVDLFIELVRIPDLVAHENFSLEALLIREEVLRRKDGRGSWRRKGWSIYDRRLLEVIDRQVFSSPAEYGAFLPAELPQAFTSADLARALGKPRYLAQKMAYCMRKMEVITMSGKEGNAIIYSRGK
jgi:hypothetical protein